jgi:hypothetical protein
VADIFGSTRTLSWLPFVVSEIFRVEQKFEGEAGHVGALGPLLYKNKNKENVAGRRHQGRGARLGSDRLLVAESYAKSIFIYFIFFNLQHLHF